MTRLHVPSDSEPKGREAAAKRGVEGLAWWMCPEAQWTDQAGAHSWDLFWMVPASTLPAAGTRGVGAELTERPQEPDLVVET